MISRGYKREKGPLILGPFGPKSEELYMNALQLILMNILNFSMGQGENHYTKASINRIIEILSEIYDVHVHRRWVFKCIRWLIDHRYITRKSRYENDSAGHVSQKSSMISFRIKGMGHLVKFGVARAKQKHEDMKAWFKRRDGRWPSEHDYDDGKWQLDKASDREAIKSLLAGIGDSI